MGGAGRGGRTRSAGWVWVTVAAVLLAACSSAGEAGESPVPAGETSAAAAPSPSTTEDLEPAATTGPVETAAEGTAEVNPEGPHTMASLVETFIPYESGPDALLPVPPAVQVVDLGRVRQLVEVPPSTNPDATEPMLLDTQVRLMDRRFGTCVPFSARPTEALGWEPGSASGVAQHLWEECHPFYAGDNVLVRGAPVVFDPLPEWVYDLGEGLYTDLEGEDRESQARSERPGPLHLAWWPTRIAVNGPDVFFTPDTPTARAWLAGDSPQALGADERFMEVVNELDSHDVFTATIRDAHDPFWDLRESRDPNLDQRMQDRDQLLLIRQSCERVGVGFSANDDGDITTHVVYQFPDEQTASAAFRSVADAWSSGWGGQGVPIEDVEETLHSVQPKGDLIVVTADVGTYGAELTEGVGLAPPLACVGDA